MTQVPAVCSVVTLICCDTFPSLSTPTYPHVVITPWALGCSDFDVYLWSACVAFSPPSMPSMQFYVTRHFNHRSNGVQGQVFDSEADATASFESYVNKGQAAAMWDAQPTELRYYGSRGARARVSVKSRPFS